MSTITSARGHHGLLPCAFIMLDNFLNTPDCSFMMCRGFPQLSCAIDFAGKGASMLHVRLPTLPVGLYNATTAFILQGDSGGYMKIREFPTGWKIDFYIGSTIKEFKYVFDESFCYFKVELTKKLIFNHSDFLKISPAFQRNQDSLLIPETRSVPPDSFFLTFAN